MQSAGFGTPPLSGQTSGTLIWYGVWQPVTETAEAPPAEAAPVDPVGEVQPAEPQGEAEPDTGEAQAQAAVDATALGCGRAHDGGIQNGLDYRKVGRNPRQIE